LLFASTFIYASDVNFSQPHGFYTNSFTLNLSSDIPGATIRYTTDGSAPTTTYGTVGTSLTISTTTVVQAIAYTNAEVSASVAQTYIYVNDVINQSGVPPGYPSVWDGYTAEYDMDPNVVNNPSYSNIIDDMLTEIPTVSIALDKESLFNTTSGIYVNSEESGIAWERATSVELIHPDGTEGFQENAGLRIHGGSTRRPEFQKHALRVNFKNLYGPGKLKYKLFPDSPANEFDTFVLRMIGHFSPHDWSQVRRQNSQFEKDQFARTIMDRTGNLSAHGIWVHVYLNGMYWGVYNLVERPEASFMAEYLGGDKTEYDAINSNEAVDGDLVAWNQLHAIADAGLSSASSYNNFKNYVDVKNLADYIMMNQFMLNTDWDYHNWYAGRKREAGAGLMFFGWDTEFSLYYTSYENSLFTGSYATGPRHLFHAARQNQEFRVLFGDRLQCNCFDDGVLEPSNALSLWNEMVNQLDDAIIPETARWGDTREDGVTYTYLEHIVPENSDIDNLIPQRTPAILTLYENNSLYPTTDAVVYSQAGGFVPANYNLTFFNPNGGASTIYYTTDGTDPRLPGGAVNGNALVYNGSINISVVTEIQARVLKNGIWSAMCPKTFYPPQNYNDLVINEIHYNPLDSFTVQNDTIDGDEFEFIEIKNDGNQQIDLTNVYFDNAIRYTFPFGTILQPGDFIVLAENLTYFQARYGFAAFDQFSGKLSNGGETVTLLNPADAVIDQVTYDDVAPWPTQPDGNGPSLALIQPNLNNALPANWAVQPTGLTPDAENQFCTPITISINATDVTCKGDSDGVLVANVTGGNTPYSYAWSNGASTSSNNNITAGIYTLTITDNYGCTESSFGGVDEPNNALTLSSTKTDQTFYNTDNGSINLSVSGGWGGYTYTWSNGASTQDINGLAPGNYMVTVKDAESCTKTLSVTINPVSCNSLSATLVPTNIDCFSNASGSIVANVSGGQSPYTYDWSNNASTANISGLTAGSYSVDITDNIGCPLTKSVTLTEPSAALSASTTKTDETFLNANDGTIDLTVSGGTAPYTYAWSNNATTQDLNNLSPGNYSVTITDNNGCTETASATINAIMCSGINLNVSATDALCNGDSNGSATVSASGGVSPYVFSWSTGAGNVNNISSLAANSYTVSVVDGVGCSDMTTFNVTEPAAVSATLAVTNQSYFNTADGAIDVSPAGGTTPYTYSWIGGAVAQDTVNVLPGNYSVTITDANNCQATYTEVVEPVDCLGFTATVTKVDVDCTGQLTGELEVQGLNGTAPYSYQWTNGSTNATLNNLPAGPYSVTAYDNIGCPFQVNESLTEPAAALSLTYSTVTETQVGIADGMVDITVNGGVTPYTYFWSDGSTSQDLMNASPGAYTVDVTDANNCVVSQSMTIAAIDCSNFTVSYSTVDNTCFGGSAGKMLLTTTGGNAPYSYVWSNGSAVEDQYNQAAGTYTVEIKDDKLCTLNETIVVNQPAAPLQVTFNEVKPSSLQANDGSLTANVTGGTGSYSYYWTNFTSNNPAVNLQEGNYGVTITDANNCDVTETYFLLAETNAPDVVITSDVVNGEVPLTVNFSGSQTTDPDNDISNYNWNFDDGSNGTGVNAAHTFVNEGTYDVSLTVFDQQGNATQETLTIIVFPPQCMPPSNLLVNSVGTNSATFVWDAIPMLNFYEIFYRKVGAQSWQSTTSTVNFLILNGLDNCENYELRLRADCGAIIGAYTPTVTFTTNGCSATCPAITGLFSQNVTASSAFLVWDIVPQATYTMYYRAAGGAQWFTYQTAFPIAILFSLPNCTTFEWYVDVNCTDGSVSPNSPTNQFTTINCPSPRLLNEQLIEDKPLDFMDVSELSIYPNPAQSNVNIQYQAYEAGEVDVVIRNMTGQILQSTKQQVIEGNQSISIQVNDIPNGHYILQLNDGIDVYVGKLEIFK